MKVKNDNKNNSDMEKYIIYFKLYKIEEYKMIHFVQI